MTTKVKIFTDGGCHNSGPYKGLGAWAYVIVDGDRIIHEDAKKGEPNTTNNRMEYIAFIEALTWCLKEGYFHQIEAYSDSQLLVNTFNEWIYDWQQKKCIQEKANPDLVEILAYLRSELDMTIINFKFQWVKGHNGNKWNEHCDKACTKILQDSIKEMKLEQAINFVPAPEELTEFDNFHDKIIRAIAAHKSFTPDELAKAQTMLTLQKPILERTYLTL